MVGASAKSFSSCGIDSEMTWVVDVIALKCRLLGIELVGLLCVLGSLEQ